jgi:hypothetical protein
MKTNFLWDWYDFGIMLRIFKNSNVADYYVSIDMQLLWLNIWITIFKKKN